MDLHSEVTRNLNAASKKWIEKDNLHGYALIEQAYKFRDDETCRLYTLYGCTNYTYILETVDTVVRNFIQQLGYFDVVIV